MYKYTRQEVAEKLGISTRSVDRYIKAGKLRSKKDGKVVYVKGSDVENLLGGNKTKQEVIIPKKVEKSEKKVVETKLSTENTPVENIYDDLRKSIKQKDQLITELSMRVGRAEEIAKNSISLVDYKKSQFLLEESKGYLNKELEDLREKNTNLENDLKYEKTTNIILAVFAILLLIIAGFFWYNQIGN